VRTSLAVVVALSSCALLACGSSSTPEGDAGTPDAGAPDAGAAVAITSQPGDQSVTVGATATFSVVATGSGTLTYVWKQNGGAISGATSATYLKTGAALAEDGFTYTVTVSNAQGSVTSAPATLHVHPAPLLYAYVANQSDNDLSGFSVNVSTGALTPLTPATFPADGGPGAVAAQGAHLYVGVANAVEAFDVNVQTGVLTPQSGSPYAAAGISGSGLAVSPDAKYLYAGGGGQRVHSFAIQADGTLKGVVGSPYTSTYSPSRLSAAGPFLFASAGSNLLVFRTSAGVLTAPDHQLDTNEVYGYAPTPDGHFAYAVNYVAGVEVFTVDPVTGITTLQAGTYSAEGGYSTRGAVVSPNGKSLYALNRSGDVTQFNIAADGGALSPATGNITTTGLNEGFEHIVLSPDGAFLYITNTLAAPHNFVVGFTVDPMTGALTQMPSVFLAGVNEQGMAFVKYP
jgi:6-phosphogluconolactonase (cycloisomerase 2 family)